MFKKKFPSLSSLGSDGNTAFLRAARAGHLDKVLEHLKANIDINTSNSNGLNALHLASKDGHVHVVTELLKRGAVVDAATKKGNTALHIASLAGQEEVVKLLVATGAAVNVQSQNGFTPLYMAAQENHDNVVRFLLANEANQSLATEDGFTPLAVAMQQGHDKVVAVLLENDTRGKVRLPALHIAAKKDDCKAAALLLQNNHNPDVTSKSGFTPLHIAAHYGNESIANLLLNRGADVNYAAKHNITPLHVAAKWGKTNMVSLLLEKGANIESKTRDGLTPLHCAARSGHEQVVDMMLERGAPISSKTKNGLAPLHMASQGDHVDAARILLYHRASVDEVTVDYLTALHVAAHCGHVRVAKLLLDRKADPNARALNGFTPLHIACKKNRIKVVELLLKHGASIEATTESGLTPLHVASFMGCMNIVIYLLQHEANPDVPTVRGETPLHLAARANQTDIIRILLRNGAQVDARAREQQTPLHIASRLGNVDIVMLLLQHGAAVDSTTKDLYTALHIAGKEGQEEVAAVLLEHGASLTATTKKGFTPLHLAAKYGNMKVAKLVLQRDAPVDAQGKNGVTPLHVASHYDHQNVALLLLDKGASPHATAKNGHTPLHIAARKNQMDIATTLLEYGAKANAESKAGFTPLHLSSQEGHTDMSTLLIEHQADTNHKAKNGLTPLHLCAQEDRVNVAAILVKNGAQVESITKAGYTPLHVASHFGQGNMVRFLLQQGGDVKASTNIGYTPLHQASQQGHTTIVNLLLENAAQPNSVTSQGQTALSIAQKLGYISVVESLKVVTDPSVSGNATLGADEKYRVVAPESMQETFMSDSEDEGGEDTMLSDQPYRYLTVDEMKSLGDDSLPIDVTRDERMDSNRECMAPPTAVDDTISPQHTKETYQQFAVNYTPDNVDIGRHPLNVGFLVSFLVDARGGAMRGCRHSGVRVIVPPRKATMPMRVTCRYLKRDKLSHPPPLMEGEALASRILELGPVGAKFLGPVIIEVPHFGSLRGMEREIVILRSDNGETWREHTLEASDDAVHQVLNDSFEGEELSALEEVNAGRTTRILTTDFPQYFAVVSRIRQEVHAIGPEGGMVSSSVVPQVQAVFPQGALTKKIKVGLQAQPVPAELTAKLLGNRVAVSPIVTVEPRRRKFHKPITLTIPVPQAANKGMINQYSGDAPTLRLLCSITGGTTRAQWEDVTGSTPLTFVNDCVSFTTTVSARFWLMDCRNIGEATKMATELYKEAIHVPFMAKFVVFSKRVDILEARLRVFCMTDDKEDKTLEHQEHFLEVAKSRDVEVLEGKSQYVEFAGNLVPVTKSGDQLQLGFRAFRENRLPFTVRVKDPHADTVGRILFMKEAKVAKGEPPQQPICILNIVLPETILPESGVAEPDIVALHNKYTFLRDGGLMFTPGRGDVYQRTDLRLSDISNLLGDDWVLLATELKVSTSDVNSIKTEYPSSGAQQAMAMLRLWLQQSGNKATGNALETALRKVGREDIIQQCIFNVDEIDRTHLDQSGFDSLKEELGPSRDTSLRRDVSLDITYDEQDIMKESESVEELVEAEKKEPYQDKNITNISGTKDDVEKQTTDVEETKYIGEEKVVEEERKSVAELKEIFAQDKRDRQYERQPRPFSDKETPPQSADDVTQRATTTIDDDTTTTQEVRRIMSIPISDIPDRLKDDDTSRIIPSPSDTLAPHTASEADQRRDSELFQGVSEELVRLETTYKVTPAEEESEVLSPKVSKTPPPSPAEFKDTTGVTTWQTSDSLTTAEQPLSSQEWTETSQDLKTEEVKPVTMLACQAVGVVGFVGESGVVAKPSLPMTLSTKNINRSPFSFDIQGTPYSSKVADKTTDVINSSLLASKHIQEFNSSFDNTSKVDYVSSYKISSNLKETAIPKADMKGEIITPKMVKLKETFNIASPQENILPLSFSKNSIVNGPCVQLHSLDLLQTFTKKKDNIMKVETLEIPISMDIPLNLSTHSIRANKNSEFSHKSNVEISISDYNSIEQFSNPTDDLKTSRQPLAGNYSQTDSFLNIDEIGIHLMNDQMLDMISNNEIIFSNTKFHEPTDVHNDQRKTCRDENTNLISGIENIAMGDLSLKNDLTKKIGNNGQLHIEVSKSLIDNKNSMEISEYVSANGKPTKTTEYIIISEFDNLENMNSLSDNHYNESINSSIQIDKKNINYQDFDFLLEKNYTECKWSKESRENDIFLLTKEKNTHSNSSDFPFERQVTEPNPLDFPFERQVTEPYPLDFSFESQVTEPNPLDFPFESQVTEPNPLDFPFESQVTEPNPLYFSFESQVTEPYPLDFPFESQVTEPNPLDFPFERQVTEPYPLDFPFESQVTEPNSLDFPFERQITEPNPLDFSLESKYIEPKDINVSFGIKLEIPNNFDNSSGNKSLESLDFESNLLHLQNLDLATKNNFQTSYDGFPFQDKLKKLDVFCFPLNEKLDDSTKLSDILRSQYHENIQLEQREGSVETTLVPQYHANIQLEQREGSVETTLVPQYHGNIQLEREGSVETTLVPQYHGNIQLEREGSVETTLVPEYHGNIQLEQREGSVETTGFSKSCGNIQLDQLEANIKRILSEVYLQESLLKENNMQIPGDPCPKAKIARFESKEPIPTNIPVHINTLHVLPEENTVIEFLMPRSAKKRKEEYISSSEIKIDNQPLLKSQKNSSLFDTNDMIKFQPIEDNKRKIDNFNISYKSTEIYPLHSKMFNVEGLEDFDLISSVQTGPSTKNLNKNTQDDCQSNITYKSFGDTNDLGSARQIEVDCAGGNKTLSESDLTSEKDASDVWWKKVYSGMKSLPYEMNEFHIVEQVLNSVLEDDISDLYQIEEPIITKHGISNTEKLNVDTNTEEIPSTIGDKADVSSFNDGNITSEQEGHTIKTEIKLLVKTSDLGKEAIEIHSVREFVDSSKAINKNENLSQVSPIKNPTDQTLFTGSCDFIESRDYKIPEPIRYSHNFQKPKCMEMYPSPSKPTQKTIQRLCIRSLGLDYCQLYDSSPSLSAVPNIKLSPENQYFGNKILKPISVGFSKRPPLASIEDLEDGCVRYSCLSAANRLPLKHGKSLSSLELKDSPFTPLTRTSSESLGFENSSKFSLSLSHLSPQNKSKNISLQNPVVSVSTTPRGLSPDIDYGESSSSHSTFSSTRPDTMMDLTSGRWLSMPSLQNIMKSILPSSYVSLRESSKSCTSLHVSEQNKLSLTTINKGISVHSLQHLIQSPITPLTGLPNPPSPISHFYVPSLVSPVSSISIKNRSSTNSPTLKRNSSKEHILTSLSTSSQWSSDQPLNQSSLDSSSTYSEPTTSSQLNNFPNGSINSTSTDNLNPSSYLKSTPQDFPTFDYTDPWYLQTEFLLTPSNIPSGYCTWFPHPHSRSQGDLVASHQEKEKDLQVTSVEKTPVREEEEEDGADTQPEVASARLQTTQTRVVGDDGFITTVTTVTQQRESPDNSDLQELLDKLAQEKH